MKRLCGVLLTGVIVLAFLSVQTGCGGGKASTSLGGGQDANLTALNAAQASDAVTQAVRFVLPTSALVQAKALGGSSGGSSPLMSIVQNIVPLVGKQMADQKQSASLYSAPCNAGGNIEVTSLSLPDIHLNVTAHVKLNDCTIASEHMSGELDVTLPAKSIPSGISDIQRVTDFTIVVSSLSYSDRHWSLILPGGFTVIANGISYDGNNVNGGSFTVGGGGNVTGTFDASPLSIGFDSLGFQFSSDASGITASVTGGRINASCLGGFVTLSTNQQVFLPTDATCPTQGEIAVSAGGNTVRVNFSDPVAIRIFFNNTLVQTLTNRCNDLIGLCVKP